MSAVVALGLSTQVGAQAQEAPYDRGIDQACREASPQVDYFRDVDPTSPHAGAIDCLRTYGIVQGDFVDGAPAYRPHDAMTRQQLATVLGHTLRVIPDRLYSLVDPDAMPDFVDVADISAVHRVNVALLQEEGIIVGYADGTFRPYLAVNRAQMATFIAQTIEDVTGQELPRAEIFDDLRAPHGENIEKLAAIGVVQGKQDRTYDPDAATTRAQMGSFVASALDYLASLGYLVPIASAEGTSGTSLGVTGIDLAAHDDADRVTFAFGSEDDASPGWQVRYVDEAIEHGRGDLVDVQGDAILEVVLTGVLNFHEGRDAITFDGDGIVEVVDMGVFEGRHLLFIGTTGMTWFDVQRLEEPQRVVIDVRHP